MKILQPVDNASLIAFRIGFGLMMFIGVLRFFFHGWIDEFYIQPVYHFAYDGLEFIKPWPPLGMYLHFGLMGLAALCIGLGLFYRTALLVFLITFVYVELIDKTNYLNHYYLVSLLAALMLFMPLDGRASLDRWRGAAPAEQLVPGWCLLVLRLQIGLVYFFAGLAKLKSDWLFDAMPLKIWFAAHDDLPVLGPWLQLEATAYGASWFGAIMDLSMPLFLSMRRTRPYAFAVVVVFHLATATLFNLGLFPFIMILGASLFFAPDWPTRWLDGYGSPAPCKSTRAVQPGWPLATMLGLHFAFQFLWPLRSHLTGGNVLWHEDGYRFSWNVMLMEKTGRVLYQVTRVEDNTTWLVYPEDELTDLQLKMMATQPDMILQYAKKIRRDFQNRGMDRVQVHAHSYVSLNGRPSQRFVDPTIDLSRVRDSFERRTWILPAPEKAGFFASRDLDSSPI